MFCVYQVKVNDVVRYIGVTNNLKRRVSEHKRYIKSGKSKYLYEMIRSAGDVSIEFSEVCQFDKKIDALRMEAYMILTDYYDKKLLWQSAPFSFKYF
ncbi:MAG: GIY-YIG nuclease family protein [Chitinophagales bacterium]|nr:GIY-YIG nuclease family protein [Chitinophagales bacterium]